MKINLLKSIVLVFAVSLMAWLVPQAGFGQVLSGSITGTIVDSTGAAVVGADVSATNLATNVATTTKTNASGEYRFDNLLAGDYRITASFTGFKSTSRQATVLLSRTGTVNLTLQPGTATETVEVSGAAPIIDTTTDTLGTTYDSLQMQDLPTAQIGLGVLNLSLLQSGVGSSGGLGAGTGPSISGQRPRDNNFMIEGVDNNDKGVTGPLVYIPNDAVANFTILQNQFGPEFGHSTGGQFNTTIMSGTNDFHGRAYEYFQNRNLNAIDYSVANQFKAGQKPVNPRYDNNRFGGQLGGPIFKNKLFFFANYEQNPIGQAAVPGSPIFAPTAAGYSTLLAIPGVSQNNIKTLQQYAVAPSGSKTVTVGGQPVQIGVLPIIAPNYSNFWALTTSMDYDISATDQLRGRYVYNKSSFIDTSAELPVFYTTVDQPYHLASLAEFHTFSPTIANEFHIGFSRTGYNYTVPANQKFPGLDSFPNITIDDLGGINVGPDPNAPQYSTQNGYQATDNITWIKGDHSLKFGIEGHKWISPQLFIQRSRGDYDWSTLDAYAFDNLPDFAQRSMGSVGYSGDNYAIYWFANDTWKIRPNLSLNLGIRYEFTQVPFGWTQMSLNSIADVPGLISFTAPKAPKNDYMPRVGFAWSPGESGNTSVRGGFAMAYDVLYDNIGTLSRPPQIGSTINCPDPACSATNFLANGGIKPQASSGITTLSAADARANTSSFLPNNVQYPYSEEWNLGVQHVFGKNYTAEARYVGTRGIHLNVQNIIDFVNIVTPSNSLPTYLQAPSQATLDALTVKWASTVPKSGPNGIGDVPGTLSYEYNDLNSFFDPRYLNAGFQSPITGFMPWGASTYHGLQTQLTRRMTNGLQFQVAYTFSHALDNSTADFFSTIVAPRRPQNFRDLHSEWSSSPLDHRHRVTLQALYEVPWFKNSNWFMKNILGNYEFAPVYIYETGQWGTVQSGVDSNLNADSAPDRAIFNPNGIPGTGSGVKPLTNSNGDIVAYQALNPTAQYIVAGLGALANSGRDTLRTPPINNWDVTLAKHFNITERQRVDFSFGMFNAFNHPQFTTGSLNQVNSISRTSTGERNFFIPNKSNFDNPKLSWPSNARTAVVALRYSF